MYHKQWIEKQKYIGKRIKCNLGQLAGLRACERILEERPRKGMVETITEKAINISFFK